MTTDRLRDSGQAVDDEQKPRWLLKLPSLSEALKPTAIASGVIYAGLFLGYRKYYDLLGVRPESVGVSSTFVLVRSIGFILIAGVLTVLAVLLTAWFNRALKQRPWTRRHVVHIVAVSTLWIIVSACLVALDYPQNKLAASMGAVLIVACIAMAQFSHDSQRDRSIALVGLAIAATTIVLVPVAAAIVSAYIRADLVKRGKESTPVTILGIPLLDVSAEKVQVTWICPAPQRPAPFKESPDSTITGILVGETSTSYYIRLGDENQPQPSKIADLPMSCAFLTHEEPLKAR